MGSGYSADTSSGSIAIQLSQPLYYPGSQINGWIHLNLYKSWPSNFMEVLVTGKEKTKVVYVTHSGSGQHQRRHVHEDRAKKEFFAFHYQILSHLPDQFPAGQYSYPFSFLLPGDLRPSFEYTWNEEGRKCYGRIEYKVKGVMLNEKAKKLIKNKVWIVVDKAPVNMPQLEQMGNFEAQVLGYCGTDKGNLIIRSRCEKSEYQVGETARMIVEIDATRMNANIRKIKVMLKQYLSVQGNSHTKTFANVIQSQELMSVAPGQVLAGANALYVNLPIVTQGPYQSNVKGDLVKCQYVLEQLCDVDRCQCYNDDAKSEMEICVVNPPSPAFQMPQGFQAGGWNPRVMEPLVMNPSQANAFNDEFRRTLQSLKGEENA